MQSDFRTLALWLNRETSFSHSFIHSTIIYWASILCWVLVWVLGNYQRTKQRKIPCGVYTVVMEILDRHRYSTRGRENIYGQKLSSKITRQGLSMELSGKTSQKRSYFSKDLKEVKDLATQISGWRIFPAERTVNAKALRLKKTDPASSPTKSSPTQKSSKGLYQGLQKDLGPKPPS